MCSSHFRATIQLRNSYFRFAMTDHVLHPLFALHDPPVRLYKHLFLYLLFFLTQRLLVNIVISPKGLNNLLLNDYTAWLILGGIELGTRDILFRRFVQRKQLTWWMIEPVTNSVQQGSSRGCRLQAAINENRLFELQVPVPSTNRPVTGRR